MHREFKVLLVLVQQVLKDIKEFRVLKVDRVLLVLKVHKDIKVQ